MISSIFFPIALTCVASVSVGLGAKKDRGTGLSMFCPRKKWGKSQKPAPFFTRAKHRKSRSSAFHCSPTPQKRLLRRLRLRLNNPFLMCSPNCFRFGRLLCRNGWKRLRQMSHQKIWEGLKFC